MMKASLIINNINKKIIYKNIFNVNNPSYMNYFKLKFNAYSKNIINDNKDKYK